MNNNLNDLLTAAGSAHTLSLHHVISAMLLSFVLCSVIAKLYQLIRKSDVNIPISIFNNFYEFSGNGIS